MLNRILHFFLTYMYQIKTLIIIENSYKTLILIRNYSCVPLRFAQYPKKKKYYVESTKLCPFLSLENGRGKKKRR